MANSGFMSWTKADPAEAARSERNMSALSMRLGWEERGFAFAPPWEHPSRLWVVTAPDGETHEYGGREADQMMADLAARYPEPTYDFSELGEAEFITLWAGVRHEMAVTRQGTPGYREVRRKYRAAQAEYELRENRTPPDSR